MKKLLFAVVLLINLSCQQMSRNPSSIGRIKNLEPIYGTFMSSGNSINFIVKSKGCTTKNNFKLIAWKHKGRHLLKLKRVKKDICKKLEGPRIVRFSLKKYAVPLRSPMIILNKYINRPMFLYENIDWP